MDINETEGLEFMGYNLKEEMYKNMLTTKSVYVRLFTNADFKLYKGLDLGVKFQYERTKSDAKQYDEADSYIMRDMVNRYASKSNNNFIYNIPQRRTYG